MNNDQVCHAWAHQQGSSAKNGTGSLYFEGRTIWSYGSHFPIATYVSHGVYLITTDSYSPTTGQHISKVRQAIPRNAQVFWVADVLASDKRHHRLNHDDYKERVEESLQAAARSRTDNTRAYRFEAAERLINEANAYNEHFKLGRKPLEAPDMEEYRERLKELDKAKRQKAAKARLVLEKQNAKKIEEWRQGANHYLPSSLGPILRVVGDTVESSRGVRFPAAHCKLVWGIIRRCADNKVPWYPNPEHKPRLGVYQVDQVSATGIVTAGCHVVPYGECEYVAKQLGLA